MLYLMGESNVRTKVFDQAMYRQVYKSSVLKTKNSTIFQTIYFSHTLPLMPSAYNHLIFRVSFIHAVLHR